MQKSATESAPTEQMARERQGRNPGALGGGYPRAPATNAGFTPRADGAREGAHPAPQSRPPNIRQCPATARVGYRPTGDERRCYCEGKGCGREDAVRAHAQAGAAKPTPAGTGRMAGHAAGVGKR